ncbi:alpha-L-rhamnosidase C-terminal domain-containing protein [Pedobacter polysacchareus]|uniref:alpha-L-rhamnosidase-related protein n=1 Tax=Pedobacter polysacchareus TaxID=2861973 RepID=UPI001C992FDA|nr:alpha-L-rhamnosidase C-terminal domain-containing protein [Pedobacter polysacchareus]
MNQHPLIVSATFKCEDNIMKRMWTTGYKGIQQLASKICYDAAYFEQLPYTGDTRIQALQALYLSGDDKLIKKAIMDFYNSKTPEYMTNTRTLGGRLKIIPTFSLYWICMIYDYWMHRNDDAFIEILLPSIHGILDWYERQLMGDQEMLGAIKWWNFVDWDKYNGWGISPDPENGKSAIMSFQYAYTLKLAAKLFNAYGDPDCAKKYNILADEISRDTLRLCFNEEQFLIADNPDQNSFSQYTNIWAILSGAVEDKKAIEIMYHLLYNRQIIQVSNFYKFYLNQALKIVNMADQYQRQLASWQRLRNMDFKPDVDPTEPILAERNGWSKFPNYEFLATICGITSAAPGFNKIMIKPALGDLTNIEASMPHPNGTINIRLMKTSKESITAEITLPPETEGFFIWSKKVYNLKSGFQRLVSIVFNGSLS